MAASLKAENLKDVAIRTVFKMPDKKKVEVCDPAEKAGQAATMSQQRAVAWLKNFPSPKISTIF